MKRFHISINVTTSRNRCEGQIFLRFSFENCLAFCAWLSGKILACFGSHIICWWSNITQNSQSEAVIKKIPVGVGVSVLSFLSRDHTKWSILEVKDNRRSLTWNIDLKNKKDGGGLGDKSVFFDFTRSSVSFLRAGLPSRVRAKLIEKTKNHMLGYSLV